MSSKSLKSIIRTNKTKGKTKQLIAPISENDSSDSIEYESNTIRLNELIYPCKDKILYTKIILNPNQMNNDIYMNLKKNLIEKLEGKCIGEGYIIKIYKIIEYTNGIIDAENFTGSAIYNIKYLAKICIALKETTIVAKITEYLPNANFALAEFGNIIKIIFTKNERDLNTQIFKIGSDKSIINIKSQQKLQINDYVVIKLKTIRFYQNDIYIKCMAYLDNFASKEEIEKYAYKDDNIKEQFNEQRETIYYNDDTEPQEIIETSNTMII